MQRQQRKRAEQIKLQADLYSGTPPAPDSFTHPHSHIHHHLCTSIHLDCDRPGQKLWVKKRCDSVCCMLGILPQGTLGCPCLFHDGLTGHSTTLRRMEGGPISRPHLHLLCLLAILSPPAHSEQKAWERVSVQMSFYFY